MDEMMNYETVEEIEDEVTVEDEGSDLGKGVLIGAGVVGAGVALFALGKKFVSKIKGKKDADYVVIEGGASTEEDVVEDKKPKKK